ncbi:MAG: flavodoxin domain-containing protein [Halobacteriota archaeon]
MLKGRGKSLNISPNGARSKSGYTIDIRTLIIYVSLHHGNTKKVADVMAAELQCQALTPSQVDITALTGYALLGFGSGLYFGPHHRSMLDFARALPPTSTKAFVFSTRGSWNVGRAQEPLKQILKTKGLHVIGEFSCRGFDTVGPLKYIGGIARGSRTHRI